MYIILLDTCSTSNDINISTHYRDRRSWQKIMMNVITWLIISLYFYSIRWRRRRRKKKEIIILERNTRHRRKNKIQNSRREREVRIFKEYFAPGFGGENIQTRRQNLAWRIRDARSDSFLLKTLKYKCHGK